VEDLDGNTRQGLDGYGDEVAVVEVSFGMAGVEET
jgi:hypothetical protein